MSTVFCDGLKEVTILNGVARLEFYRLQAIGPAGPNRDMQPIPELSLALPAQGLVQLLALLDQMRDKMIKAGSLNPTETTPPAPSIPDRPLNFQ